MWAIPSAYAHSQNSFLIAKGSPCFHWPAPKRWPSHQPPSSLSLGLELGMVGVKGGWIAPGVRMPATHPQPGHSPAWSPHRLPQGQNRGTPSGSSLWGTSSIWTFTQVSEEHREASAGCSVRGFLEDRWPSGSLGRGAMAWVQILATPPSAEKHSWSSLNLHFLPPVK